MKKRISLIFLFALFFSVLSLGVLSASDENISIGYNPDVHADKNFSVSLELLNFSGGTYDVKIDIFPENSSERISQIFDSGKWKSTFYYATSAISPGDVKMFIMKVSEYSGRARMVVKIKDGNNPSKNFDGYFINILEPEQEQQQEQPEQQAESPSVSENNSENNSNNKEEINPVDNTPVNENIRENIPNADEKPENLSDAVINISAKSIKTRENSAGYKIQNLAVYGIIFFCILLIILFLIKKIINKKTYKNEFR